MTQDEIIRMAREAGSIDSEDVIETVWAAFAAAEREACAKVASSMVLPDASNYPFHIAATIRSRSKHG